MKIRTPRSAAQHWGWEVKTLPARPEVTVPENRKVSPDRRAVILHRGDLHPSEVSDGVTTRLRTVADCLRNLPVDEALCVGDSALRNGFSPGLLRGIARSATGPGSRQMRVVASLASSEAANAFESTTRAIAFGVPGLVLRPQLSIRAGDDPVTRMRLRDPRPRDAGTTGTSRRDDDPTTARSSIRHGTVTRGPSLSPSAEPAGSARTREAITVTILMESWVEDSAEDWGETWDAGPEAEDAMQWLSNIGQGIASGAATGAVAGPWGALIGGLVGGGLGAAQTALAQQKPPAQPAPAPPSAGQPARPTAPRPAPARPAAPGAVRPATTTPTPTAAPSPQAATPSVADVTTLVTALAPLVVALSQQLQPAAYAATPTVGGAEDVDEAIAETDCWPADVSREDWSDLP